MSGYNDLARLAVTVRPIDAWPGPRNPSPTRPAFRATLTATIDLLARELAALTATGIVLQVDVAERDLRLDGLPRADARIDDRGVLLGFESRHGPLRYACDRWTGKAGMPGWQANLRAVALTLEALRAVDRYGATARGEQYRGFAALPAGQDDRTSVDDAARYLLAHAAAGIASVDDVRGDPWLRDRVVRDALKRNHPDNGGDPDTFRRLTAARDALRSQP